MDDIMDDTEDQNSFDWWQLEEDQKQQREHNEY